MPYLDHPPRTVLLCGPRRPVSNPILLYELCYLLGTDDELAIARVELDRLAGGI